jgi:aminoglycoside/choline kinase family phosphotransferase
MDEKSIVKILKQLFKKYFFENASSIKRIKGGVSERNIYKIESENYVCIGVHNHKLKENIAFIEFSESFRNAGLSVPEIYIISDNGEFYLEEFLGDKNLFELFKNKKITCKEKFNTYKKVLSDLIAFQLKGKEVINYKYCYETKSFNKKQIYFDLNKFYNYYLCKLAKIKISISDFEKIKKEICKTILKENQLYFMYRDFQPRNIMINDGNLSYIDYQSGRKGALQYDVASFLYSGSINLTESERKKLLYYYINEISKRTKTDKEKFKRTFYYFVLIRLLQVLGSYGYTYEKTKDKSLLKKIDKALCNLNSIKNKIIDKNIKLFLSKLFEFKRKERKVFRKER